MAESLQWDLCSMMNVQELERHRQTLGDMEHGLLLKIESLQDQRTEILSQLDRVIEKQDLLSPLVTLVVT